MSFAKSRDRSACFSIRVLSIGEKLRCESAKKLPNESPTALGGLSEHSQIKLTVDPIMEMVYPGRVTIDLRAFWVIISDV